MCRVTVFVLTHLTDFLIFFGTKIAEETSQIHRIYRKGQHLQNGGSSLDSACWHGLVADYFVLLICFVA
jgi:hypothetical protein